MVLVDTSVWVQHLRHGNDSLSTLLGEFAVICHPFIIGELACGNLKDRAEILSLLDDLPRAIIPDHEDVMDFVERNRLFGRGLGWIDQHLLVSALLSRALLWTYDSRLRKIALQLRISHP